VCALATLLTAISISTSQAMVSYGNCCKPGFLVGFVRTATNSLA